MKKDQCTMRTIRIGALALLVAAVITSVSAQGTRRKPEPLMVQEQGSFAVGGSVTIAPGTFDPIKQGAYNPAGTDPAGQTLHGDHAYVFFSTQPLVRLTARSVSFFVQNF